MGHHEHFCSLALGISDASGNYSAVEHVLGPKILQENHDAIKRVCSLASQFRGLQFGNNVPELVENAGLKYIKIGVGSEISCMMNPQNCWTANTKTAWAYLAIRSKYDFVAANEQLQAFRDKDESSAMAYRKWTTLHAEIGKSIDEISEELLQIPKSRGFEPIKYRYLWADAFVANWYGKESFSNRHRFVFSSP